MTGWRIKKIVARYQTLYSYTLLRIAFHGVLHKEKLPKSDLEKITSQVPVEPANSVAPPRAYFDRGMFHVPINGKHVSFALMPPYLRTMIYSRSALEAQPGWPLTQRAYREMKRTAEEHGATMVVMYIPFKSQLYLPVLERLFPSDQLNKDFRFYFRENQTDPDVRTMSKNRLAQNAMMSDLCHQEGMLFLDLTPALQQQVDQGNTIYFPDDAHWNAAGHELAARELAAFLKQHHLYSAP